MTEDRLVNLRGSNGRGDNGDAGSADPAGADGPSPNGAPSPDDVQYVTRLAYGRHLRVLLVDGDADSAEAFLAAADEAVLDVAVEVAPSVDDALDHLVRAAAQRRRKLPDIVISATAIDESHQLLTRLRSDGRFDAVPVLVLSHEAGANLERRSFSLGAAGHLRAPRVDYERVALVHALPDFMPTARAALAQLESRR